ncbi:hypothetical protein V5N11_032300 [Cardamine amara subsp. amara]|uniref:RRM domain-containing protein n=1 Tax=Cardamine amara subsp. amara TaxID=228776 RepID=A0ABD1AX71_CARAN
MAIARLLSPKLTPPFNNKGSIPLTRRWLSSSLEDSRKFEKLTDSEASVNKDIGQKGLPWYSLGGLLTNFKEKIVGNVLSINKTSAKDLVPPKWTMISSSDVTATTKVVSLQDAAENSIKEDSSVSEIRSQDASQSVAAENKSCIPLRRNEESSVSEMGSQDASQSVAGIESSGKTESTSVNKESLDSNERVDPLKEPSSKDFSLGFLTEEVSETLALSGKNQGKLHPEKEQFSQKKSTQKNLSSLFIKPGPNKEVKLPLRFEALSNSNPSMSTGESCNGASDQDGLFHKMLSDPVQKNKSISKENDKNRLSDALQHPDSLGILLRGENHDQNSGDLAAIRERKSTFSFESSRKTVEPMEVSKEFSMKKVMESLNLPTNNGTDADANLWNPNGGEGKGNSVTKMSDRFCAMDEAESKEETLVMQNQSLCSEATLATTTANPKVGEHSPNKVLLRFLRETCEKKDIIEVLHKFGAVLDVQEIPSFEGCIYKDAFVTFETNEAMKKALKKAVVLVKGHNVVIEATFKEDMVEKICIPDLIGDPDVPIALVKEPTRTVKIHPLKHNISSNQIKEALKFCRSDISKLIFGSSKTAVFVEFETEDGKERALAEHSINISNKQVFISRIDIPRTTVVRISNLSDSSMRDLLDLCRPYGQIKRLIMRGKNVGEVRFKVSEWPNMLTILNSMNGKQIDGMKWVVQAATTVIPPEILTVLWEDPKEKRYVKSVIQNLVREIEKPLDVTCSHTLVRDLVV